MALNALALSPAPYLPPGLFDWWDKAQHAIGFGTLAVLIEVLQHLGGYRFGDWQDAVADGVGVLGGLVGVTGLMRL